MVSDRTDQIGSRDLIAASTVRNEIARLPFFLSYYRKLGIDHFLFVDNDSDDGTREFLGKQPDVSLWATPHSYKLSRFGIDWLTWLQIKYAHGHWCLTVDADEFFVYPYHDERPLRELTNWLDANQTRSFGAIMLDMYPKGRLAENAYVPGNDPFETLCWFDADNYTFTYQPVLKNLWIQGGVRARRFFSDDPRRAPTLGKKPLVKWNRRYVYVSSTHSLLPRCLNDVHEETAGEMASGVLLHAKFLDSVVQRSAIEKQRKEHFANSEYYESYYDSVSANPCLWCADSVRYSDWKQLESLGLMSRGQWR